MRQPARLAGVIILALALCACVAGSGESQHAAAGGALAQFLLGLWHGIIAPLTLIVEVVRRFAPHLLPWEAHMYETKAVGVAYDVGFYFGLLGGPSVFLMRGRR